MSAPWNQFALKMDPLLPAQKNAVYSPLSLWTALALLESGAADDTKKELRQALSFGDMSAEKAGDTLRALAKSSSYEIVLANAAWPATQFSVKPEFESALRKNFDAEFKALDYAKDPSAARAVINQWVSEKTRKKIPELLPTQFVTPDTKLILTNAVYFKANWADSFSKGLTKDEEFHVSSQKTLPLPTMKKTQRFGYFEDPRYQALKLDYRGREMFMLIVLPRPGAPLSEASTAKVERILSEMKDTKVEVSLPKFKMEAVFEGIVPKLNRLGLHRVFAPLMSQLPLFGGNSQSPLFVSQIVHKAMIDVNESGTEAAAATAMSTREGSMIMPGKGVVFKADRPFRFFVIHDPSKAILFAGQFAGN